MQNFNILNGFRENGSYIKKKLLDLYLGITVVCIYLKNSKFETIF